MWSFFEEKFSATKDDERSSMIRQQGNDLYSNGGDLDRCLDIFSDSLRYATYKSESYAIALANRSSILFKLSQYGKCIEDIDLCLEAQYPNNLKPKVYLRKCECFKRTGELEEMSKTADEFETFLKNFGGSTADKYRKELRCVITSKNEAPILISNDPLELPYLDENDAFPGASKNVAMMKDRNGHFYVSSSTALKKGQVLFVEKAYAMYLFGNCNKYCQYCAKDITNGVPCKGCIKHMYCTKVCRNLAWNEFHQWECYAVQAGLFEMLNNAALALRIVLKACQNENIPPAEKNIPINKYSSIYHIPRNKKVIEDHIENAHMVVNYLKRKTTFFQHLKSLPNFCDKSDEDLTAIVGGLLIRHVSQMVNKALTLLEFTPPTTKDIGLIACSTVSQLPHSCDPNTIYYFHNDVVVVKALTDIDANTRLTISHTFVTYYQASLKERKDVLWDSFHLNCECLACSNSLMHLENFDAYICVRCRGPAVADLTPRYKCLKCGYLFEMPPDVIQKMESFDRFLNLFQLYDDIDMAKKALALGKTFLQPYHQSYGRLYEDMGIFYSENGDPVGALLMWQQLLQLEENRLGPCSVETASRQIYYSKKILECLEKSGALFSSSAFRIELNKVNSTLEKATEICSSFCPVLLNDIKTLKLKHVAMKFARNVQDMYNSG